MTTDPHHNARVVRDFTRIFKNQHHVEGVDHLFHPDFTHHFRIEVPAGLVGFKSVGRIMNGAFPDVVVTEEDLVVTDDRVVERSSAVATHLGPHLGVRPTGQVARWSEIHIYGMREGLIALHWAEWSQHELLAQLSPGG